MLSYSIDKMFDSISGHSQRVSMTGAINSLKFQQQQVLSLYLHPLFRQNQYLCDINEAMWLA